MARRLVERGVRFVQLFAGGVGNQNVDTWDAHGERFGMAIVALIFLLGSGVATAQQTSGISGVVKDSSGAVLPGVTVEAASPALIEKVRTATSDGEGRYNIVDLTPGTYAVSFS